MNSTACVVDPAFVNSISQLSHFAWGAFAVMAVPAIFRAKWLTLWAWLAFELYAALKESIWDPMREECDFSSFDTEDFLVYTAGTTVGVLIAWWSLQGSMHPFKLCNTPPNEWRKIETDCVETCAHD